MQGDLQEFNIRSILQFIEMEQYTGTLYIESKDYRTISNQELDLIFLPTNTNGKSLNFKKNNKNKLLLLFFTNGKITCATNNYDKFLRIFDYLQYFCPQKDCEYLLKDFGDSIDLREYSYIWQLLQEKLISPQQALTIIKNTIIEIVGEIIDLSQGNFVFRRDNPIIPQWAGLTTSILMGDIFRQLRLWKQFFPYIQSPHQYLILSDVKQLSESVSSKTYKTLSSWAEKKLSLLRLSRQLNYSLVDLAKAFYPCIKKGWLGLSNEQNPTIDRLTYIKAIDKTHVVYLADEMTIDRKVEYILKQRGYNSTILTIPSVTLTTIMQVKPDLIICDWDMLQPDGYEICSMLQNSPTLRQIPIVAISEQEDYLIRLRTKILSLADYLSKPFTQNELLMVVERSLKTVYQSQLLSLEQSYSAKSIVQH
ncbi:MAG: response regulator [Xenococcaceae cyanobacterium]